ncbi:MAG: hypothetical protein ABIH82_03205 [Candidatus Woesearchaeota archaeon]
MKYLLTLALLTGTVPAIFVSKDLLAQKVPSESAKVSNQIVDFTKEARSFRAGDGTIYERSVIIGDKHYRMTYEDRGKEGRSVEDVLIIEGKRTMFEDQGLDGVLECGQINNVNFIKGTPEGYWAIGQEAYQSFLKALDKKIDEEKKKQIVVEQI